MKYLIISLFASALLFVGCGKKEGGAAVDTANVESALAGADSSVKTTLDSAIASVKSGDYSGAVTTLQKLASDVKLTPAQQQAVKDFLAQVQAKVTSAVQDATKGATDAANKAAGDAQKALGK
jgi:outer membrane protein assembly factor BamD (BamD/ComL family)